MTLNKFYIFLMLTFSIFLNACSPIDELTDVEKMALEKSDQLRTIINSSVLWCNYEYSNNLVSTKHSLNILKTNGYNAYHFKGVGTQYEFDAYANLNYVYSLEKEETQGTLLEVFRKQCGYNSLSLMCFGVHSDIVQISKTLVEFDQILNASGQEIYHEMSYFPENILLTYIDSDEGLRSYIPCKSIENFRVSEMNETLTGLIPQ